MIRKVREGDLIAIPVTESDWCVAVVARVGRGRKVRSLLVYCFPTRFPHIPDVEVATDVSPGNAVLIAFVSELGLVGDRWKCLGPISNWNPVEWPVPVFGRRDVVSGAYVRAIYATIDDLPRTEQCPPEEGATLPEDGLAGYGYLENRLRALTANGA